MDLDESLVRQVADLVGVASHQPSIILALVAFKDHGVRTPILFQSCRFCDVCYTSSGIFCEKKGLFLVLGGVVSKRKRGLLYMHITACSISGSYFQHIVRRVQSEETTEMLEASTCIRLCGLQFMTRCNMQNTTSLYNLQLFQQINYPIALKLQLNLGLKIFQNVKK